MKRNDLTQNPPLRDKQFLGLETLTNEQIFTSLKNTFKAIDDHEFTKVRTKEDVKTLISVLIEILSERNMFLEDEKGKRIFDENGKYNFSYREKLIRYYDNEDKHFTKILIVK